MRTQSQTTRTVENDFRLTPYTAMCVVPCAATDVVPWSMFFISLCIKNSGPFPFFIFFLMLSYHCHPPCQLLSIVYGIAITRSVKPSNLRAHWAHLIFLIRLNNYFKKMEWNLAFCLPCLPQTLSHSHSPTLPPTPSKLLLGQVLYVYIKHNKK